MKKRFRRSCAVLVFALLLALSNAFTVSATVSIAATGVTQLLPADATLIGPPGEIRIGSAGNIGHWRLDNRAEWAIRVATSGTYRMVINYGRSGPGAGDAWTELEMVIRVGERSHTFTFPPTGGFGTYRDFELGTIELLTTDTTFAIFNENTVQMSDTSLMNLMSLSLELIPDAPAAPAPPPAPPAETAAAAPAAAPPAETAAAPTAAPAAAPPAPPAGQQAPPAPQTFDPVSLIAAGALLSAAGVTITAKRRKNR